MIKNFQLGFLSVFDALTLFINEVYYPKITKFIF